MNRQLDYNRLRFIQMQKRQRAVAKQILSDEVRRARNTPNRDDG